MKYELDFLNFFGYTISDEAILEKSDNYEVSVYYILNKEKVIGSITKEKHIESNSIKYTMEIDSEITFVSTRTSSTELYSYSFFVNKNDGTTDNIKINTRSNLIEVWSKEFGFASFELDDYYGLNVKLYDKQSEEEVREVVELKWFPECLSGKNQLSYLYKKSLPDKTAETLCLRSDIDTSETTLTRISKRGEAITQSSGVVDSSFDVLIKSYNSFAKDVITKIKGILGNYPFKNDVIEEFYLNSLYSHNHPVSQLMPETEADKQKKYPKN